MFRSSNSNPRENTTVSPAQKLREKHDAAQQVQQQCEDRVFHSWLCRVCEQVDYHLRELSRGRELTVGNVTGARYGMDAMVMLSARSPGVCVLTRHPGLPSALQAHYQNQEYGVAVGQKVKSDDDDGEVMSYTITITW